MRSVDDQLRLWQQRSSKLKALFSGDGIDMSVSGILRLIAKGNALILVDEKEESLLLSLSLDNVLSSKICEPLVDAPEELRWKIDFLIGVAFNLPCGFFGLFETADS